MTLWSLIELVCPRCKSKDIEVQGEDPAESNAVCSACGFVGDTYNEFYLRTGESYEGNRR